MVFITTTNNNGCPLNSQWSSFSEMCFFKIMFLQKLGVHRTGRPDLYYNVQWRSKVLGLFQWFRLKPWLTWIAVMNNYHFSAQIHIISFVQWMLFLIKDDYNVTRFNTRLLITFTRKCYFLSISHTLVNMNFQNFTFFDCFPALTVLAAIFLYRIQSKIKK